MARTKKVARDPIAAETPLRLVAHPSWTAAGEPQIGTSVTIAGVPFRWDKVTSPENGVYAIACKPLKSGVKTLDDMRTVVKNTVTGKNRMSDGVDCDTVIAQLAIRAFRFDFDNGIRNDISRPSDTEKVTRLVAKAAARAGVALSDEAQKKLDAVLAELGLTKK